MTNIVEIEDFSFRYPHTDADTIHHANLTIEKGSITLLYGLSGSGKSTLCYAMTGLIPWSVRGMFKGTVKISDKSTIEYKPNQFAGDVGYLMQNPDSQFATLNVRDELIFAAENIQIEKNIIESRLKSIIELLNLEAYIDRNVTQLSSGEKQRVVLGSILMMEPSLLILDEPLSFLDFSNRLKLLEYLKKIKDNFPELSIIIAEHRIHDILPLVNAFLHIQNGNITNIPPQMEDTKKFRPKSSKAFSYHDLIQFYGFRTTTKESTKKQSPIIRFTNVSFDYMQDIGNFERITARILNTISFCLYPGERIALVGPNGIGKTTLLYLIAGVLHPTEGKILYHEEDISEIKYGKYSRNIGLVFQNPESQLLKNTTRKEIEFGPKNFDFPITEETLRESMHFVFPSSLEDPGKLLTLHPFNLSWGEKRRLNLTSLYSYSPMIYLFDEPFTGQDFIVRKKLIENINTIRDSSGLTVISSHDDDVFNDCDRVFLLDQSGFTIYEKPME